MKDPNYLEEAKKYTNPIPSREFILSILAQKPTPLTAEQIFEECEVTDEVQQQAMIRRLRAMEREGQVIFNRKKRYALPEKMELIKGTVIGHKDGFGFLQVVNDKEDWFIPPYQMQKLIHGDYVLAQPIVSQKQGEDKKSSKKEVRIVRILSETNPQIVGRFFIENGISFVVADDNRIHFDILIPDEFKMNAKMGQVVVVEIMPRQLMNKQPVIGHIIEIIGEKQQNGIEVDIAIRKHKIPYIWPEQLEQQLLAIPVQVTTEDKKDRVDLTDMPLVTIDGEDSRDFDDAIYCIPTKNGWKLWVAIADVSYYVTPNSELDKEAQNRGNSVYFPTRVIPMLPEELSNGICSLNPQVERLCMVAEIDINLDGNMQDYKFYPAVMQSHARLTYTKVWNILNGDAELITRYQPLVTDLQNLYNLYHVLAKARIQRGAISFNTAETKFIYNAEGKIANIEPLERNDAHKIVEECMILANVAAANFISKNKQFALYRVHAGPSSEKLADLRIFLKGLNLSISGGNKPTPLDYEELLQQVQGRPDAELVQLMLLRSMQQAIYTTENAGHFGLALAEYTHFTSPIRRYPDLVVHRVIKFILQTESKQQSQGAWQYQEKEVVQLGFSCSSSERRADEATRDVADWLKCEYMQDHITEEFDGIITNVNGFGFFVKIPSFNIDGLVHISTLLNDYYIFDHAKQQLIGENTRVMYRIGDEVKIVVLSVHMDDKRINFGLVADPNQSAKKRRRTKAKTDKSPRISKSKKK